MSQDSTESTLPMTDRQLIGAFEALRFVMVQLERKAANAVWNAKPWRQTQVVEGIMDAAYVFSKAIEKYVPRPGETEPDTGGGSGGGSGPKCDPLTEHEEFGQCVPNN